MRAWSVLAAAVLLLAGCAETPETEDATDLESDDTGNATLNVPPAPSLTADLLNGTAPLAVNFTIDATDNEADNLSWVVSVNGTDVANGTVFPATVSHVFAAGNHTVELTVDDGTQANSTQLLVVAEAGEAFGPIPDPLRFEGTHTGVPTIVLNGCVSSDRSHDFSVDVPVRSVTMTLAFPGGVGNDLDWTITGPGIDYHSQLGGAEVPITFEQPAPGDWNVSVECWSADGEVDYTVDVEFA